ncbi:TetR family transcriptional regulator [Paraburkholderia piptadeniae]|uniref:TetR family transcriptional regulator n=1 Tax=Paraburkholderia piptadeniae TaxID=1701573 RepID=A0A1N7RP92_9BURK|nr:TetR/AcrR family transcriptional regulator [Paraburkholderia piptadeniae]SIT36521.1 TetR family transcriptional regulator [Paraburkholderia piptadeniae]
MATRTTSRHTGDTKSRILDASETLFIECGYEAMSLRQITSKAEVNLAAVNYHFGSKEALMHAMLSRRLDLLNQERLKLLDRFDALLGPRLTCEHVLGAMFIPALRVSRDTRIGGKAFLRLLGRAYTDPSSFIRDFLSAHYASVSERFFEAFQRALPHLPREELGWRLHFAIGALSGVLAGADTNNLITEFSQGKSMSDLQLIARLASLIVSALKAPLPDASQLATFASVLGDAGSADIACDAVRDAQADVATNGTSPAAVHAQMPAPGTPQRPPMRAEPRPDAQPYGEPAHGGEQADAHDAGSRFAAHG